MQRRALGFVIVVALTAALTAAVAAPAGAATAPGAPGKPSAVAGNHSVRLSWPVAASHGAPISAYLVTPYLGATAQTVRTFKSNATRQTVTGLTNGRVYTFRVAARNKKGTGPISGASPSVMVGTPTAPKQLRVVPGNAQATVMWSAAVGNGAPVLGYVVTPFLGQVAQPAQVFLSRDTAEVVTGLQNGHSYTFRVAARNLFGTGAKSAMSRSVQLTAGSTLALVMNNQVHTQILANVFGQTLYLYAPDGTGTQSTADAATLRLWPAVAWSGTATVAAGLDASKVTIAVQHDGTPQLAYNGHLLYTFAYEPPGYATGENQDGFSFVSAAGDAV